MNVARFVKERLAALVSHDTISSKPMIELGNLVASWCDDLGFQTQLIYDPLNPHKANVLATIGPNKPGGLMISGHLDVVPTEGQPWNTDPFSLTEKDEKLYGRGTADMKGFIASTFTSLQQMSLTNLQKPLALLWTYDEEVGGRGSKHFADHIHNIQINIPLPTQALIGEPTDFHIFNMHPGYVTLAITTTGQAAHSSKPDLGASAISAMQHILYIIEQYARELKSRKRFKGILERPFTTINVGQIRGGSAVNIVPDHCQITVSYRPLPGDNPEDVYRELENRIRHARLPKGTTTTCELLAVTPALLTHPGQPLEAYLTPHAATHNLGAAAFATDGGNLSHAGIKSLIFGPGSIDVAHKANEYIDVNSLVTSVSVVQDIIQKWCC